MNGCSKCGGLIAEPGKFYGYAGKFCLCIIPSPIQTTTIISDKVEISQQKKIASIYDAIHNLSREILKASGGHDTIKIRLPEDTLKRLEAELNGMYKYSTFKATDPFPIVLYFEGGRIEVVEDRLPYKHLWYSPELDIFTEGSKDDGFIFYDEYGIFQLQYNRSGIHAFKTFKCYYIGEI